MVMEIHLALGASFLAACILLCLKSCRVSNFFYLFLKSLLSRGPPDTLV